MSRCIGVIGSSNIDLVTRVSRMPEAGETLAAENFSIGHGGKGANQAIAAARLGADVLFVTRVGDDAFGTELLHGFADAPASTRARRARCRASPPARRRSWSSRPARIGS